MSKEVAGILYFILGILSLGVGALCVEIGRGTVPIPAAYSWTVPILLPMLVGLAARLRKLSGEGE